jgi:glycosyltransferase involved in cell wall biosynthesis
VPEFPGQTHAFFWREIAELRRQGALPHVVSTRLPPRSITSHEWSAEAIRATTYLGRPTVAMAVGAARVLLGSLRHRRLVAALRELRSPPESPKQRAAILLGGALLAATARRQGWDHVHVHSCAGSARIALIAKLLGGPSYSLTLHGSLADYGPHQGSKWADASFGLIITRDLLARAQRTLGDALPAAVSIAPMGVDLDSLDRHGAYAPWSGEGDARLFSCGRLNPAKGHDNLIRAVAVLVAEGLPVRLAIAGEDEEGGTGYRATLERLVGELGLRGRVDLLGAVDEQTVRAQLERAHVFALASHAEPLGVAIMEAMAMAAPVVIGDGGGVRELVDDGRSGLLVDPETVDAIAAGIRTVLSDPQLAERLGVAGRARVRAEFGSAKSAGILLAMVRDL